MSQYLGVKSMLLTIIYKDRSNIEYRVFLYKFDYNAVHDVQKNLRNPQKFPSYNKMIMNQMSLP